jgi:hypothetical protein
MSKQHDDEYDNCNVTVVHESIQSIDYDPSQYTLVPKAWFDKIYDDPTLSVEEAVEQIKQLVRSCRTNKEVK